MHPTLLDSSRMLWIVWRFLRVFSTVSLGTFNVIYLSIFDQDPCEILCHLFLVDIENLLSFVCVCESIWEQRGSRKRIPAHPRRIPELGNINFPIKCQQTFTIIIANWKYNWLIQGGCHAGCLHGRFVFAARKPGIGSEPNPTFGSFCCLTGWSWIQSESKMQV